MLPRTAMAASGHEAALHCFAARRAHAHGFAPWRIARRRSGPLRAARGGGHADGVVAGGPGPGTSSADAENWQANGGAPRIVEDVGDRRHRIGGSGAEAAGWRADRERRQQEDFYDFLYGVYPVLFALRAGKRRMKALWVQGTRGPSTLSQKDEEAREEIERRAEELGVKVFPGSRMTLDKMCGDRPHQGYVLKTSAWRPDPLKAMPAPRPGALWLALEGVTDPMNLGGLLRSAAFFGAEGVLCEQGTVRLTAVASKASAGAGEVLPVLGALDLGVALDHARGRGWRVVGTALPSPEDEGVVRSSTFEAWLPECAKSKRGTIIIFGSEGAGLPRRLRRRCDTLVHLEGGLNGLDSLNVSVAAGIIIHGVRSALGPQGEKRPPAAATHRTRAQVATPARSVADNIRKD